MLGTGGGGGRGWVAGFGAGVGGADRGGNVPALGRMGRGAGMGFAR